MLWPPPWRHLTCVHSLAARLRVGGSSTFSDLEGCTLEPGDIMDLKDCRPGKCGVQLPVEAMRNFQRDVNWSGADVATQANDRLRRMAVDFLRRYWKGGSSVLGTYGDKEHLFDVRAQLQSWLGRSEALTAWG